MPYQYKSLRLPTFPGFLATVGHDNSLSGNEPGMFYPLFKERKHESLCDGCRFPGRHLPGRSAPERKLCPGLPKPWLWSQLWERLLHLLRAGLRAADLHHLQLQYRLQFLQHRLRASSRPPLPRLLSHGKPKALLITQEPWWSARALSLLPSQHISWSSPHCSCPRFPPADRLVHTLDGNNRP